MNEQTNAEFEASSSPHVSDPAAWAALSAASRAKADAFLDVQSRVARAQELVLQLQAEDLKREDRLRHWSLIVRHTSDVLKLVFEVSLAVVATAILAFAGAIVWDAAHDDGLVIEAFQVPPDFVARGHSGQVLANQLLDKLNAMQSATDSARPARSYGNDWQNDIKVQIADTGVSLGEFDRYLHAWLGHQTHISGEVFQGAAGRITLTARVSGGESVSFTGNGSDVDALVQKAAERIYRQTQPYRYAVYRMANMTTTAEADWREAQRVFTGLTFDSNPVERAWAWLGMSNIERYHDRDARASSRDLRNALAAQADMWIALLDLNESEGMLGHTEASLAAGLAARNAIAAMPERSRYVSAIAAGMDIEVDQEVGDFQHAIEEARYGMSRTPDKSRVEELAEIVLDGLAAEHDARSANVMLASLPHLPPADVQDSSTRLTSIFQMNVSLENWPLVAAGEAAAEKAQREAWPGWDDNSIDATAYRPWLALARAELGDFRSAETIVGTTPTDCYDCTRVRGTIAALARRPHLADRWFEDAVHQGPSIPFAYFDWGKALVARHDTDGAIEKFREANRKGPHFADPLEMWGEALMAKNRSDLALAKFEEANKYAPNWRRLHLEWGEALYWTGDKAAAREQFAVASRLDLSASDRAALATRMR